MGVTRGQLPQRAGQVARPERRWGFRSGTPMDSRDNIAAVVKEISTE